MSCYPMLNSDIMLMVDVGTVQYYAGFGLISWVLAFISLLFCLLLAYFTSLL